MIRACRMEASLRVKNSAGPSIVQRVHHSSIYGACIHVQLPTHCSANATTSPSVIIRSHIYTPFGAVVAAIINHGVDIDARGIRRHEI